MNLDYEIELEDEAREPRINVSFILEGCEFSKEYIYEKLRLEATRFRTKMDWPDAIINWQVYNPNLPDEYKPRTIWELSTGYEECLSVTRRLQKIIGRLKGKEAVINQLCQELNLRVNFTVSIEVDLEYFPEIALEKEELAFMAKIGADIGFCFYAPI